MKKITAALLTLALAGTLAACGGEQSPATNSQPAADNSQAASDPAAASGSVTTLGSTSMNDVMNYLAEGFREVNGNVTVTVEGGGSSASVEAALTGPGRWMRMRRPRAWWAPPWPWTASPSSSMGTIR